MWGPKDDLRRHHARELPAEAVLRALQALDELEGKEADEVVRPGLVVWAGTESGSELHRARSHSPGFWRSTKPYG